MNFHELKAFLTASGLLATVLTVWLRFWHESRTQRNPVRERVGFVWSSTALLVVLAAIALAVFQKVSREAGYVSNEAIGLFLAALAMTWIDVGESWFHALVDCAIFVIKGTNRMTTAFELSLWPGSWTAPDGKEREGFSLKWLAIVVTILVVCPASLIVGLILFSRDNFSFSTCSAGMWLLVVAALAVLLIVAVFMVGAVRQCCGKNKVK